MSDVTSRTQSAVQQYYKNLPVPEPGTPIYVNKAGVSYRPSMLESDDVRDRIELYTATVDSKGTVGDLSTNVTLAWSNVIPAVGVLRKIELKVICKKQTEDVMMITGWAAVKRIRIGIDDQTAVYEMSGADMMILMTYLQSRDRGSVLARRHGFSGITSPYTFTQLSVSPGNYFQKYDHVFNLELLMPFYGPEVTGQVFYSNSLLVPQNNLAPPFTIEVTLNTIEQMFKGVTGTVWANVVKPEISLVQYTLAKSIPAMTHMIQIEKDTAPYEGTFFPQFFTSNEVSCGSLTSTTINLAFRDIRGATSFLLIWITKQNEAVTLKNPYSKFVKIGSLIFKFPGNPSFQMVDDPYSESMTDIVTRTFGSRVYAEYDNLVVVPLCADLQTNNYTGFIDIGDNSGALEVVVFNDGTSTEYYTLHVCCIQPAVWTSSDPSRGAFEMLRN